MRRLTDVDWLAPRLSAMADIFPIGRPPVAARRRAAVPTWLRSCARPRTWPRRCGGPVRTRSRASSMPTPTPATRTSTPTAGRAGSTGRSCSRGRLDDRLADHLATVLDIEDRRRPRDRPAAPLPPRARGARCAGAGVGRHVELYTRSFSYGYFLWVITRISSRDVVLIHIPRSRRRSRITTRSAASAWSDARPGGRWKTWTSHRSR